MNHFTVPSFWQAYDRLPRNIQALVDKNFELLKENPKHPSLHFKKIDKYWSARVGIYYRVLAVEIEEGLLWFWIGTHTDYDKLVR
ncbi:MAG: hypothetical protein JXK05_06455 [Campylobacterales bacterium]|nr:hypothetical protein [Campylobacterales bacterium]